MRPSLSLHRALFRRQRAQIAQAVEGKGKAFARYEDRYRRRTRTFERTLTSAEVSEEALAADVVYVGDYHTLRPSQQAYLDLVLAALRSDRPVVMALELVEARKQPALDAYLAGRLSERRFLAEIGHSPSPFGMWPGFRPLLELARARRIPVAGIDRRSGGARSLELRDRYAAARIAALTRRPERPRVLVLMGQYHVAPGHLPAEVRSRADAALRHLVVYQNCDALYWKLAEAGQAGSVEAVRLREGELCLFNASPVICQQSFLDYLEAEAGDEPLAERAAAERFREMARLIGRMVGVRVEPQLPGVEVATCADLGFVESISRRGGFKPRELAQIRRHVLSRESCYLPRARTAYLGSLSLNHAAEEAAHFVRHCCIGEAMERPRSRVDAFYARCLEEALGFLGSKLVNPQRTCVSVGGWAEIFEHEQGQARQIAAYVLAHRAAEQHPAELPGEELLPLSSEALFHAVSHALGYLLGERLFQAMHQGALSRDGLRALFRDPLDDARAAYFAWLGLAGDAESSPKRRHPRRAARGKAEARQSA